MSNNKRHSAMGDFNISNANGKTLFSFVIPPFKNKISYKKLIEDYD